MKQERKAARDKLKSIKTLAEFSDYLSNLAITDEQRQVTFLHYARGFSYAKISLELNMSVPCAKAMVASALDKI